MLTLHQLERNQHTLLVELERGHANLVSILAQNLSQIINQKQMVELLVAKWLDQPQPSLLEEINQLLYQRHAFNRLALYDRDGNQRYQSSVSQRPVIDQNLLDQCLSPPENGEEEKVVIVPLNSSGFHWQLPLLFPVRINQQPQAVMLLELDLGHLVNLFQQLNLGQTGKLFLLTQEGRELVGFESGGLVQGKNRNFASYLSKEHQEGQVTVRNYSAARGFHLSYKKISAFPLLIAVTQDLDEILAGDRQQQRHTIALLSVLTLMALIAAGLLLRFIHNSQRYLETLQQLNEQNQKAAHELERQRQHAEQVASFDALTGLYNRRLFVTLAEKNLQQARRNGRVYAVLFMDLDRFKQINDTFGHAVGDQLLKSVAHRLNHCTREGDVVARFGGDEFVLLLTAMADEDNLIEVAHKIIDDLSHPYEDLATVSLQSTPSLGIAIYPGDGETIEALMRNADAAMYQSKRAGRGRATFFDSRFNASRLEPAARQTLGSSLSAALASQQLRIFYQPVVRASDQRAVGLEALLRWRHPVHGLLHAEGFLPEAQKAGLLAELDQWLLKQVCRHLWEWRTNSVKPLPVSVNLSRSFLDTPQCLEFIRALQQEYGILAPDLVIEVSEADFIQSAGDPLHHHLAALHQQGLAIDLDQYRGRLSLIEHPAHNDLLRRIKLDGELVRQLRSYPHESAAIASALSSARPLHRPIDAVAVESSDQLASLKMMGCDHIQGHAIARPINEKEIINYLASLPRTPDS